MRPLNAAIMAVGVVVGALLGAGSEALASAHAGAVLLTMVSAVAIGAGANAINDVFDVEIDRVNRPARPLPSGAISVETTRWLWMALSGLGVLLAAFVSIVHVAIAAASVGLLYAYSASLKKRPLVGNLAVAVVVALALPFGGLAVLDSHAERLSIVLAGGGFAFLTTLAREIIKDIEDLAGDAAQRARTLPIVVGPSISAIMAIAILLATAISFPLVVAAGLPEYFLPLGIPAAMLLLGSVWYSLGIIGGIEGRRQWSASRASTVLKVAMVAGLLALALAAW